jgi:hypothetical protein
MRSFSCTHTASPSAKLFLAARSHAMRLLSNSAAASTRLFPAAVRQWPQDGHSGYTGWAACADSHGCTARHAGHDHECSRSCHARSLAVEARYSQSGNRHNTRDCAQAHRHTGTQAHRHTGTQAHRRTHAHTHTRNHADATKAATESYETCFSPRHRHSCDTNHELYAYKARCRRTLKTSGGNHCVSPLGT